MIDWFRPVLELTILFPGAVLCYLSMRGMLKSSPGRTALWIAPLLLIVCLGGGLLCYDRGWRTDAILFPALPLCVVVYCRSLRLSFWKSFSILLAVCGIYSCLGAMSIALDSLFRDNNAQPWRSWQAGLIYNGLCWLVTGLVAYPAIKKVPWLLTENSIAQTWYVFWMLPAAFMGINRFMVPIDYRNIRIGRMLVGYLVMDLVFLGVLLLFYLMFYLMARGLDNNTRLHRENQFLQMQTAQYEALRSAIAETRQIRHDLRHHVNALAALAEREDWTALRSYLNQTQDTIPTSELTLCENPAVDGVAGHYAALCRREEIPFACRMNLPRELPVAEMPLCVTLSNLLENALEASGRTEPSRRYIRVEALVHGERLVLLTVENAYFGQIREENGVFRSSKRPANGVGLQSVRRIAEENGGYCNFEYADGVFRANVMLRGE